MKYQKLKVLADAMGEAEMRDSLTSLVNDQRFAAVVKLLSEHREQYVSSGSQQNMAAHHGALAHAAGSVYALETFSGVLKQFCDPPKKRGVQTPPK